MLIRVYTFRNSKRVVLSSDFSELFLVGNSAAVLSIPQQKSLATACHQRKSFQNNKIIINLASLRSSRKWNIAYEFINAYFTQFIWFMNAFIRSAYGQTVNHSMMSHHCQTETMTFVSAGVLKHELTSPDLLRSGSIFSVVAQWHSVILREFNDVTHHSLRHLYVSK